VISGTGALTKNGSGTLTLAGNNNYSGNTTINTGTVVIGHANAAGTGRIIQLDGNSLLKFDTTGTITNNMSVYNVLATQSATLSGAIEVNNATWDVETGDTLTISGGISGNGGVTKNGGGTLVLSGSNTYQSATTINAGTLNAANANALGSNNTVTVNDGTLLVSTDDAINGKQITLNGTSTTVATLAFSSNYTGSIGRLTLSANSIIDLGQGNVALQFVDMIMGFYNLSIYNWSGTTQWGTTYGTDTDRLYFNGNFTASNVKFYSGAVGSDSFIANGFDMGLQNTSWAPGLSGHYIIPVPEPETYATGLLLVLSGAWWMWKRKPKAEVGRPFLHSFNRDVLYRRLFAGSGLCFAGLEVVRVLSFVVGIPIQPDL
jgi:autotransporter-associated beta strand protein